jgi:hypothetical protein
MLLFPCRLLYSRRIEDNPAVDAQPVALRLAVHAVRRTWLAPPPVTDSAGTTIARIELLLRLRVRQSQRMQQPRKKEERRQERRKEEDHASG